MSVSIRHTSCAGLVSFLVAVSILAATTFAHGNCMFEVPNVEFGFEHHVVLYNSEAGDATVVEFEFKPSPDAEQVTHWFALGLSYLGPSGMAGAEIYMIHIDSNGTVINAQVRNATQNGKPPLVTSPDPNIIAQGDPTQGSMDGSHYYKFNRYWDPSAYSNVSPNTNYLNLSADSVLYVMFAVGPLVEGEPTYHAFREKTAETMNIVDCEMEDHSMTPSAGPSTSPIGGPSTLPSAEPSTTSEPESLSNCTYTVPETIFGYSHFVEIYNDPLHTESSTFQFHIKLMDAASQADHWFAVGISHQGPEGMAGAEIYMVTVRNDSIVQWDVRFATRNGRPGVASEPTPSIINQAAPEEGRFPDGTLFLKFPRYWDLSRYSGSFVNTSYLNLMNDSNVYILYATGPWVEPEPMKHEWRMKTLTTKDISTCYKSDEIPSVTPTTTAAVTASSSPGATATPTGTTAPQDDDVCFPADAVVQTAGGAMKRMEQLEIGDRVLVGVNKYSDVYFFGHRQGSDRLFDFVELELENGQMISLSSGHLIWVNGEKMQPASSVHLGDRLLDVKSSMLLSVTRISQVRKPGLYNPHTLDGEIVVNGIQASSYTSLVHPKLAHMMLMPERTLYRLQAGLRLLGSHFEGTTPAWVAFVYKHGLSTLVSAN